MLRRPLQGPWQEVLRKNLGLEDIRPQELQGINVIFHLAGKAHVRARSMAEIAEYETVHVHGTRSLLQAAKQAGVSGIVFLSSVATMCTSGKEVWDESSPCQPQTPYGKTKLAAEHLILQEVPLPCPVVLRPPLVYGPGAPGNLNLLLRGIRSGLFPAITFPANARSMIHVADVVQACLLAATHPRACGQTYILTDGHAYATTEIVHWLQEALGKKPHWRLPFGLLRLGATVGDVFEKTGLTAMLTSDRLEKLTGSALYSNARICQELGFAPQWDLRRGIRQMTSLERGQ